MIDYLNLKRLTDELIAMDLNIQELGKLKRMSHALGLGLRGNREEIVAKLDNYRTRVRGYRLLKGEGYENTHND